MLMRCSRSRQWATKSCSPSSGTASRVELRLNGPRHARNTRPALLAPRPLNSFAVHELFMILQAFHMPFQMFPFRLGALRLVGPTLVLGAATALAQTGSDIRGSVTASETRGAVIGARVSIATPQRVAVT